MPNLAPYLVLGLALGGTFAVSAVGMVVLYKATGVLNLAYGAIGALSSLLAFTLINTLHLPRPLTYLIVILVAGLVSLGYGMLMGPPLAAREPLVKAIGTLALLLILLGVLAAFWTGRAYSLTLETTSWSINLGSVYINGTQVLAFALGIAVTAGAAIFLQRTRVGTAMRALSGEREITAMLGVPVRRIEGIAWSASGILAGVIGLLLSNLVGLDAVTLTFLVIPALAAALIGRLSSLWATFGGAIAIGVVQSLITPISEISQYRALTPFVFAIVALLVFSGRRSLGR